MRKKFLALALAFATLTTLVGCAKSDQPTLYVYNWGEYIDEDIYELFEEETGIRVVHNTFVQNEDMYPVIQTGSVQYDVVCPSDYMIKKMIDEGLLQELNYDNIPNIKNVDPIYLKSAEEFDPGNKYSVPYMWGTVGILYNKTMIDAEIDSWEAIFNEEYMKTYGYDGDVLMIESVRDGLGIALKYLGYSLNSTNPDEIEEATALLQAQFKNVDAYVVDQVRDKLIGGENPIGVIYSGEAIYTQKENSDLEYVVPKEGSNVWIDGWVIPKNAKNKDYAEQWINFLNKPEIALMNFEEIGYSTPNMAAKELIEDEEIRNSQIAFPDAATLANTETYKYLGEEMENLYLQKWNEVKFGQ